MLGYEKFFVCSGVGSVILSTIFFTPFGENTWDGPIFFQADKDFLTRDKDEWLRSYVHQFKYISHAGMDPGFQIGGQR